MNNFNQFQEVFFGRDARNKLVEGAKILYSAVKETMGPSGHNVMIDNGRTAPLITKDGVTVARSINLKDKLSSMGADLLKEVASKTNDVSGDGPQPLYAKVLTPNGWTTMGELKVGDKICGTNQSTQRVLAVYPKGIKNVIEITTSDGRTVECCEDHLWKIITNYGKEKILSTKELLKDYSQDKNNNWKKYKYYIPNTCVEFENKNKLLIDPYLIGILLGDGHLSLNDNIELAIGLKEEYILENLKLPQGCSFTKKYYNDKHYIRVIFTKADKKKDSTLKPLLSKLKLLGTDSYTKFIPKSYLYSSIEDRKELLRGLIDTDGYINDRGLFEFGTVSKQLYLDFIELCQSLGLSTYHRQTQRKPGNGSYSNKPIYRVSQLKGYKYGLKIKKIAITDKFTEMQCIKVSNPDHLYITNDYIVTHNTTTATVLAFTMLSKGTQMIATGRSAIAIKHGMEAATKEVIKQLKLAAIPVRNKEDIINIGTISANGDREIGEMLATAIEKVGENGIITVEPAKSIKMELDVVEGMQIDSGYLSPYFVTNPEKHSCEFEDPYVLIVNQKLSSNNDIIDILEKIVDTKKPLLVIADEVENEVLKTLIVNKMKGVLLSCAIRPPIYGDARIDLLNDIALLTGGTLIDSSTEVKLSNMDIPHLGTCKKVIITKGSTVLIGNNNEEIKLKVNEVVDGIKVALTQPGIDDKRKEELKTRLAKLSGGVAVVKVGGSTEVEILEKKDRVDDALNATQAAVQEGILPGGGVALFNAANLSEKILKEKNYSDEEWAGIETVLSACRQPLRVIVENTGKSPDVVMNQLFILHNEQNKKHGYDAHKHEYCDMIERGIIDPLKVERCALEYSCSVVGLLLTCNTIVVNSEE